MPEPDAIVIGAGLSGAVFAERLASQRGARVLVLEQRPHIAGNCHDYLDRHGVRVHRYGPHLFHTDNEEVWRYLNQFTAWHPYEHRVLAAIDDKLVPLPFNLNSLHEVFPAAKAQRLEQLLIDQYGANARVTILELQAVEQPELRHLAGFIFEKIFLNYTAKQWGRRPEEISAEITARVPILINRDDRYFPDRYQALPAQGYSAMVAAMLNHENIEIRTRTAMVELLRLDPATAGISYRDRPFPGLVVYTGMLDQLFHECFGALPYRSLRFVFEHLPQRQFQPVTTVNYPDHPTMTRITEFKHLQAEDTDGTTIVREYPQDYDPSDSENSVPYYPVLSADNSARHDRYLKLAAGFENLVVLGCLADYRYYDMDDAVAAGLQAFQNYHEARPA